MPSFDIVSRTDMAEVDNAVQGATREIATRYDFKGSNCSYERNEQAITLKADDDYKLKAMQELLRGYMVRRKVEIGALEFGKAEQASGNTLRQVVTVKQGIERELAQKIVKEIKAAKMKVQAAIQGDELRVSGKKRDDLQKTMELIKGMNNDQPLQYVNFRD